MAKFVALLLFIAILLTLARPVEAAVCRTIDDRSICIITIKRSAKNYWEYRASVKVDDVEKPIEIYNCRDRTKVQADGTVVPFEPDGAGALICSFFKS
jgi:hypothetical protein